MQDWDGVTERRQEDSKVIERLTRLEERQISNKEAIAGQLKEIQEDILKVDKKVDYQNGRVRKLEDWNIRATVIVSIIVFATNLLGTALIRLLFK